MDKKNNMKQAMFEMFGVGSDAAVKEAPAPAAAPKVVVSSAPEKSAPKATPSVAVAAAPAPASQKKVSASVSYLAVDTVLEGTLRSEGDVEIAGTFKGDITTKGTATLHSVIDGNVTANSLTLSGCTLTGDVTVTETVIISRDSKINGNVTAKEVCCAGQITGDLKIADSMTLENTAQINGNIVTGSMSVAKGAIIRGGIEIKMDTLAN